MSNVRTCECGAHEVTQTKCEFHAGTDSSGQTVAMFRPVPPPDDGREWHIVEWKPSFLAPWDEDGKDSGVEVWITWRREPWF
jgi:hypothetical protein